MTLKRFDLLYYGWQFLDFLFKNIQEKCTERVRMRICLNTHMHTNTNMWIIQIIKSIFRKQTTKWTLKQAWILLHRGCKRGREMEWTQNRREKCLLWKVACETSMHRGEKHKSENWTQIRTNHKQPEKTQESRLDQRHFTWYYQKYQTPEKNQ